MIVGGIMAAVLLTIFFLSKNTEKAFAKEIGKEVKLPAALLRVGLYLRQAYSHLKKETPEEKERSRALLIDERARKIRSAKTWALIWLLLLIGGALCFLMDFLHGGTVSITDVARPEFGEEREINVVAHGLSEDEKLTLTISGQDPSEEEMTEVFQKAIEEMKPTWLQENKSFQEIREKMKFPKEDDYGILYSYESSAPEILSVYGTVTQEEIPEEGVPVTISVALRYKTYTADYEMNVCVLPPLAEALTDKEKIADAVAAADEEGKEDAVLTLPDTVDGQAVTYEEAKQSPYTILALVLAAALLLGFLPGEREKEAFKKRNEEITGAFPALLSKLRMLIDAGMSVRSAWFRIVTDYERKEAALPGKRKKALKKSRKNYVYEEMRQTLLEIESGTAETEAYVAFGRRMGTRSYMKLGNMLSQNVKQGISGFGKALEREMEDALEERKNAALRKGEQASTKLLFPMVLMLGVVIATLIVPAFL